ncbi:hypothetical protein DI09_182p10 [Mitosporidium daphniae]|uniref:Uncharacterized protein n=1 Tax=Mitosporidium daphniae TaxID=1485682 RepID=A0A098VX99_9MICR|nr:uncharacterized protein DI09_182p10 [Mitosporidium daphniae]KGG52356.1 hypothetical protein DI09_182p10 [Mitosporidium daphniae]|eukprot:XP_013238792.1 uncharacterized protein DI09_182p10 [Mitosporidium daphniae]
MDMVDFIFLTRSWAVDGLHLKKKLSKITKTVSPLTIMLFPEGTFLCQEMLDRSHKYISQNTTLNTKFEKVLLPKSTGLFHVIQYLGDSFTGILDVTISYFYRDGNGKREQLSINSINPDGSRLFLENFFSLTNLVLKGIWPTDIYIDVQWIPRTEIPFENIVTFTTWLYSRFERKELMLSNNKVYLEDAKYSYQGPLLGPKYKVIYIFLFLMLVCYYIYGFLKLLSFGLSLLKG